VYHIAKIIDIADYGAPAAFAFFPGNTSALSWRPLPVFFALANSSSLVIFCAIESTFLFYSRRSRETAERSSIMTIQQLPLTVKPFNKSRSFCVKIDYIQKSLQENSDVGNQALSGCRQTCRLGAGTGRALEATGAYFPGKWNDDLSDIQKSLPQ